MKKPIPEDNYLMTAKTFYGLEDVLCEELRALGAARVEKSRRAVSFYGDKGFMYKANLCLRTALSILVPIKTDKVFNENQLYKSIYNIPWERYMSASDTLAVEAVVNGDKFTNSHYITLKTKDAIVDRIRDKMNARPSIDRVHPHLKVSIRTSTNIAPINEVLAAGMLLLAEWKGLTNFMDPMCGSGTILIEAAMIAAGIPACINKKEFGFQYWKDYDEELFEKMREVSLKKMREPGIKILGYDKAPSAVRKARENVREAGLEDFIEIGQRDFFTSSRPEEGRWTLMFNPPYGERIDSIDIPTFYKKIGDTLKNGYTDTSAWMITAALDGIKALGLRHSRSIPLMNAALESRLVRYDMYSGSRKSKYNDTSATVRE